jgi:hypothetical protein
MSDPTPTDVPALVDRLRERQADFEMVARHGICVQSTPERLAGEYQEAADALTALRLDVQRITEERDRLAADYKAAKLIIGATLEQAPKHEADRDAQVREAFDAGYDDGATDHYRVDTGREPRGKDARFAAYLASHRPRDTK